MDILSNIRCSVSFYKVPCGKQAVDTSLIAYLGYLIGKGIKDDIIIVSNDNGYHYAMDFVKQFDNDTATSSIPSISPKTDKQKPCLQSSDKLYRILNSFGLKNNDINTIDKILCSQEKTKGEHKSHIYDFLTEKLGQKKGLKAYNTIKPYFFKS